MFSKNDNEVSKKVYRAFIQLSTLKYFSARVFFCKYSKFLSKQSVEDLCRLGILFEITLDQNQKSSFIKTLCYIHRIAIVNFCTLFVELCIQYLHWSSNHLKLCLYEISTSFSFCGNIFINHLSKITANQIRFLHTCKHGCCKHNSEQ